MGNINFFDLAEDDYECFLQLYRSDCVYNNMSVLAANTIEKYLKHIAMLSEGRDVYHMPSFAKNHNTKVLLRALINKGALSINSATYQAITAVHTYLFCARYPEYKDSRMVNREDIEICRSGLVACRNLTLDYIMNHEKIISEELDDIER